MEPIIKTLVEAKLLHAPWNVGGRNIISLLFGFLVRGKKGGVSREFQKRESKKVISKKGE